MNKTKFFMLGIITALGALFLELLFFTFFNLKIGSSYLHSSSLSFALIFSVFLEESVKIIILYQILKKIALEKFSRKDIFSSALMIGLGFSTMEIFLDLFNSQINRYLSFSDVLGLLAIHVGTFAILGYVSARGNNLTLKKFVFFFPVLFTFHLLYNSFVIYGWFSGFYWLFMILSLIFIAAFFWDLKRLAKKESLPKSEISL